MLYRRQKNRTSLCLLLLFFWVGSAQGMEIVETQEASLKHEATQWGQLCKHASRAGGEALKAVSCLVGGMVKNAGAVIKHIERNQSFYGPLIVMCGASIAAAELYADGSFVCPLSMPLCWQVQVGSELLETNTRNFYWANPSPEGDFCLASFSLLKPDAEEDQVRLLSISAMECNWLKVGGPRYMVKFVSQIGESCIYNLTNRAGDIIYTLIYGVKDETCFSLE